MTRIDFYLDADDRLQVACRVAAKAHSQAHKVLIYAPDGEVAREIDRLLWTTPATGFVPHVMADHRLAGETPVVIARDAEALPHDDVLVNLDREQPAAFAPRPSAEFVKNMPRHFRDNLPVLVERVKSKRVEPKREHEVAYAEVEAWLKAGSPLRRTFVKRFEARAKDPEFRRKLIENLREHPEWDPVLYPEKYETKESNGPKGKVSGAQR